MLHSPPTGEHTITPPPSPTKVHLPSPSKKPRIPPSPHRPSVDAFWSHEIINEWNDRHSPTREPSFQREKKKTRSVDDDDKSSKTHSSIPPQSPPLSPRKQPTTTATKKKKKEDQPEVQRRKKFNAEKHELASSFLQEIDQTITDGKITSLASSTGGIRIVWSNKLQSTAGRAHWKGDAISVETGTGDGGGTRLEKKEYRHHATIELAEKVIDDEGMFFFLFSFFSKSIPALYHPAKVKETFSNFLLFGGMIRSTSKRPRTRILSSSNYHDKR
jgi:hypothetical protein